MNKLIENKSYFIFDLDGTLTDSMVSWAKAEIIAVKDILNKDIEFNNMSEGWDNINSLVNSLDKDTQNKIYDYSNKLMEEIYKKVKYKPYAYEFVKYCFHHSKHMCIATNTPINLVLPVLKRLKLFKYFEFIITCDDVKAKKTDPKIYIECAKRFKCKYEDIIIFEDSYEYTIKPKLLGFNIIGIYDDAHSKYELDFLENSDTYIYSYNELF